jgi:hypothetical protein
LFIFWFFLFPFLELVALGTIAVAWTGEASVTGDVGHSEERC